MHSNHRWNSLGTIYFVAIRISASDDHIACPYCTMRLRRDTSVHLGEREHKRASRRSWASRWLRIGPACAYLNGLEMSRTNQVNSLAFIRNSATVGNSWGNVNSQNATYQIDARDRIASVPTAGALAVGNAVSPPRDLRRSVRQVRGRRLPVEDLAFDHMKHFGNVCSSR